VLTFVHPRRTSNRKASSAARSEETLNTLNTCVPNSCALVWGASGFIGRHLVAALASEGWSVIAVTRPGHPDPDPGVGTVRKIEIRDSDLSSGSLRDAISESSVIYNLAGSSGAVASNRAPLASLDDNCRVQLRFLAACTAAANRPHVVFSSSRLVYGETGKTPVSEDCPVNPQSIYAAHKLCVENYLQIYARLGFITQTICRISNVYGFDEGHNGQSYRVVNAFIRAGLAGQPITLFGDGQQLRDFIYVSDLVDTLITVGVCPEAKNQTFNIGSGVVNSMYEAADLIQKLTGAQPIKFAPWPQEYQLVESGDYVADISKARSLLKVSNRFDLAAGLAEAVELHRRSALGGIQYGKQSALAASR
jgi:UDP-glucose 4-epimerase